ncbi:MAG: hypothetical protein ABW046_01335 [Actinoplanes sp.]
METALNSFFVSVPQAVALWLLLLLGVALAVALLGLPRKAPAAPLTPVQRDDLRYAGEVTIAAERAAATAARRRAEWISAQEEMDAAWRAFDEADDKARRSAVAAAYPLLSKRRKPGDNADRQRYLHHAATAACRNRELSIAQLNDVYAHRGWNPRLHPVVQESVLHGAIREHRRAVYQSAQVRERTAWETAELAAGALLTLRAEAAAAIARSGAGQPVADEHWWTDQWTTAEVPAAA